MTGNRVICSLIMLLFLNLGLVMPGWASSPGLQAPQLQLLPYVEGFEGSEMVVDVTALDGDRDALTFVRPIARDLPEGARFVVTRDEAGMVQGRLIWDEAVGDPGGDKITIPIEVSDGHQYQFKMMTINIHPAEVDVETQMFIHNVDYTAHGQIKKIEYGNGVVTEYTYDPLTLRLSRIHTVSPTGVLQDLNYQYDPVGHVVGIDDALHGATQRFKYDALQRLVRAQGEAYGVRFYTYDTIGNITFKNGVAYTYGGKGAGPHAVTALSDGTFFTYDANGNLKTKTHADGSLTQYHYDAEHRLTEVYENDVLKAAYTYDGDGGRTSKTVHGVTTKFIGSVYETTADRQRQHVFLGSTRIASVTDGGIMYHHGDHLGGANVISNDQGTIEELIEYTPFGTFARHEKYGNGEDVAWHYFTGQHYDKETDLYFYNARYYDPSLGRFITADSIVPYADDSQSFNRYTYVRNNPVNFVDPSGHIFGFFALSGSGSAAVGFTSRDGGSLQQIASYGMGGVLGAPYAQAAFHGNWAKAGQGALNALGMASGNPWLVASSGLSILADNNAYYGGDENFTRGLNYTSAAIGMGYVAWNVGVGIKNWISHPKPQFYDVSASLSKGFPIRAVPQSGQEIFINGVGTDLSLGLRQASSARANLLAYNPSNGFVSDFIEATLQKFTFTSSFDRQVANMLVGLSDLSLTGYSQGSIVASNIALNLGIRNHRGVLSSINYSAAAISQPRAYLFSAFSGLDTSVVTIYSQTSDVINVIGPNLNPVNFVGGLTGGSLIYGFSTHSSYYN